MFQRLAMAAAAGILDARRGWYPVLHHDPFEDTPLSTTLCKSLPVGHVVGPGSACFSSYPCHQP